VAAGAPGLLQGAGPGPVDRQGPVLTGPCAVAAARGEPIDAAAKVAAAKVAAAKDAPVGVAVAAGAGGPAEWQRWRQFRRAGWVAVVDVQLQVMPYEPGSPECRVLIDCKAQIETMLLALSRIDNSRHIRDQLVSVHNQLEGLHELHRRQPLAALAGE
jgi:hypothetical protein